MHKFALLLALPLAACGAPPSASDDGVNAAAENLAIVENDAVARNMAGAGPVANQGAPDNAAIADPAAAAGFDIAALAGRWNVTGVAVGGGIGALAKDDPAYMRQTLRIGADRLDWVSEGRPDTGATLSDRCDGPAFRPLTGDAAQAPVRDYADQLAALGIEGPEPHAVECRKGEWGPEAAGGAVLFPAPGGRLAMSWYDGGMLLLERGG